MRFSRSISLVVAAFVVALTFVATADASSSHSPSTSSSDPTTPKRTEVVPSGEQNVYSTDKRSLPDVPNPGEYLYVQGCSTCHGMNGAGTEQVPISLIGVGDAAVDFYINSGRMPPHQLLPQVPRKKALYTDEERAEIVKYVRTFGGNGPPIPHVNPEHGDIVEGFAVYANNCAACHNSAGSGGALGRNFYAPRLDTSTPLQIAEAVRVGPGAMPIFGPDTLSDHQLDSLLKYIETLKDPNGPGGNALGRLGPVSEGYFAWFVGLGVLLAFTRWIGTRI